MAYACNRLPERYACRLVGQPCGTQRYTVIVPADKNALTRAIFGLATKCGRGYRRITQLFNNTGSSIGADRVSRIWYREGQKVPMKQVPRGRLCLNDGGTLRHRDIFFGRMPLFVVNAITGDCDGPLDFLDDRIRGNLTTQVV
jgi:putative transposase